MRTDLVADTLTMIRNAAAAKKESVDVINSKMNLAILEILQNEGYISNLKTLDGQMPKLVRVYLRYDSQGKSVITGLKRVSKPGLKKYVKADRMPKVLNGLGLAIISTSRGIVTNEKAREDKIGGEVLLYVW